MLALILTCSHLLAAAAGGVGTYVLVMRRLRVTEHEGHLALEVRHPDDEE